MSDLPSIGFVGTGVMGASMAGHLLAAGHPLHVHNRSRAKAEPLLERGATWHGSPGSLAAGVDVVISIVGYPADVEALYLGPDGLLASARAGTLCIDCTTSSPDLAQRIAAAAAERGCEAVDAPVSGGDRGAREATLAIMVGGSEGAFARAEPVLARMGRIVRHLGPAGAGQHTKMANQIAIAAGMLGVCEALAYTRAAGLDPAAVLGVIGQGAAASWSLDNLAPRMLAGDFAPGFYVKHFQKDLGIAAAEAAAAGMELPGLALAIERYRELAEEGHADEGTQALYRLYASGEP